jgi:hypothetical protein
LDLPAGIYVDDALMLAVNRAHMETVLATAIKAFFVVMGEPEVAVRQCPLTMDRWLDLLCWALSLIPTSLLLLFHINISMNYSTY